MLATDEKEKGIKQGDQLQDYCNSAEKKNYLWLYCYQDNMHRAGKKWPDSENILQVAPK